MTSWSVSANPERFDEALRFFQRRVVMGKHEAVALGDNAAERAFWIGGGLNLVQVGRVFDEIEKAIESGEPFADFRKRVRLELRNDAHAETVFRNAVQHSYASGRHRQMTEPDVLRFRPYLMYDAVMDSRTTEEICLPRDGTVLPADHPWWRTHYVPAHHRCRSGIRNLRKSEAERRGVTKVPPKADSQKGFGRLPSAQPIPKPKKGKGPDQDKLVEELEKKKTAAVQKELPKVAPKKKMKPAKPAELPLKARAAELSNAVATNDWAKARSIVDDHLAAAFPGVQSKDRNPAWNRPLADKVVVLDLPGANGTHDWTGEIALSQKTSEQLRLAAQHLAAGTYDNPDLWRGSLMSVLEKNNAMAPLEGGFRVMIHEAVHGHTRISGYQYRGAVAVLEEVGVELTARRVLRGLNRHTEKWFKGLDGTSYNSFIWQVEDILEKHAPSLSKDILGREHFALAFEKGILGPADAPFANGGQYVDAIVDSLDAPQAERDSVRAEFKKLVATHLPASHQNVKQDVVPGRTRLG